MKKIIKNLVKKPILIVFLIILFIYLPIGLANPATGIDRFYPTSISIDVLENGEYEVGLLVFITPLEVQYSENYIIFTTRGKTIAEAIESMSKTLGKKITLTHISSITIGAQLAQNDPVNNLDYLFRNELVTNDTYLLCSSGSALDLLKIEQKVVNLSNIEQEYIVRYNSQHNFFADTNIETFYKGYFSPNKTSIMGVLKPIEEVVDEFEGESGGASSNGDSTSSGKSNSIENDYLENDMDLALFYDGKWVGTLNAEEIKGWNWVNPKINDVILSIDNASNAYFEDARMSFTVNDNSVNDKLFFENGKPVVEFESYLSLTLSEVKPKRILRKHYDKKIDYMTDDIKINIENTVKTQFTNMLKKTQDLKIDILDIYSRFIEKKYFEFTKWYENLDDKENFLKQIEFRMSVNMQLAK